MDFDDGLLSDIHDPTCILTSNRQGFLFMIPLPGIHVEIVCGFIVIHVGLDVKGICHMSCI